MSKALSDAPRPDCCVCDPEQTVRVCWCHTGEVFDRRPCQCGKKWRWPEERR